MAEKSGEEFLAAAKLGAPRGLGGQLRLQSYSGEFGHLVGLKEALVGPVGSPAAARLLSVKEGESGDWGASLSFVGYESPEKARTLTGLELFLPRSDACPLGQGEYYVHDLVGLSVLLGGKEVGKVAAVLEGGPDPLLEVVVEGRASKSLVPFRSEFVGEVDLGDRSLELLAGWILE